MSFAAKKVLVVEDSVDLRELLQRVLKGYSVKAVGDGKSALGLLDEGFTPDVVLFDMRMPGMDGSEFLINLRKNSNGAEAKAIVVSGIDNLAKKAAEMGADGFIRKPLDLNVLCKEVAKYASAEM